ncbi:uri1, prefoldin-like chaperone [Bulinus truncatus]|nr:uri1, prefoldin-like chaperone [Bulinus truncatus]
METQHLARLQEEQIKAIDITREKIKQLEKFKKDYAVLQDRLKTLPDKLSHEIMVPFGKKAFMPGRIVHTNELLVLLGDNWFVERSASQAVEIANRRITDLDKKLTDLNSQKKLLEPRVNFTSEFKSALQKNGDVKEIIEEFDEEKERLWDEQHRKNVRKYREEMKQNLIREMETEKKAENKLSDAVLWSRLDELENLEKDQGELNSSSGDSDDEPSDESLKKFRPDSMPEQTLKRRVSWADVQETKQKLQDDGPEDVDSDNEITEEEGTNDSDDEGRTYCPVRKVITFSHTPTGAEPSYLAPVKDERGIQSPADIYKMFSPKSILKKDAGTGICSSKPDTAPTKDHEEYKPFSKDDSQSLKPKEIKEQDQDSAELHASSTALKAFTGLVLEKSSDTVKMSSTGQPMLPVLTTAQEDAPKRISKFRAGRLSQQHQPPN